MTHNITPQKAYEYLKTGKAVLIDVREADEFKSRHIAYAQSIPLSSIVDNIQNIDIPEDKIIIMQCRSGKRGEQACAIASSHKLKNEIYNIDGGIDAWDKAGLPIIRNAQTTISIFRQVQIIVGLLIVSLISIGLLGFNLAFTVAAIIAGALMFAGITGWCGLAQLLNKMPWNQPKRTA